MGLQICRNYDHPEITFDAAKCPVCESTRVHVEEREDWQREIDRRDGQIRELQAQVNDRLAVTTDSIF